MFSNQWNLSKINILEDWNVTTGNPAIKITVIENGVDIAHEDLVDNLVTGYNAVNPGEDPDHSCVPCYSVDANPNIAISGCLSGIYDFVISFERKSGSTAGVNWFYGNRHISVRWIRDRTGDSGSPYYINAVNWDSENSSVYRIYGAWDDRAVKKARLFENIS